MSAMMAFIATSIFDELQREYPDSCENDLLTQSGHYISIVERKRPGDLTAPFVEISFAPQSVYITRWEITLEQTLNTQRILRYEEPRFFDQLSEVFGQSNYPIIFTEI
ncbi:hypothetical protein [Symmachiella dynata]|uniref:hypothetical protein n=1 Tax=Symmachiella dynata TaxID=2527995 RepID=UPI0030ED1A24|tara:strand:- start:148 stop:471 length:324 start_codon:yes stop_codon:yes gene_type:complete